MGSPQASAPVNNINGSSPDNKVSEFRPPANKVISVHTLGIKFLKSISQKSAPWLQNVFVDYRMYSTCIRNLQNVFGSISTYSFPLKQFFLPAKKVIWVHTLGMKFCFPPANKVIWVHTLGTKFLNGISQKKCAYITKCIRFHLQIFVSFKTSFLLQIKSSECIPWE